MSLALLLAGCLVAAQSAADALAVGDEELAIQRYEATLEENPDDRAAQWNLGFLLSRRGELERAEALFVRSLDAGPHPYPHLMLGVIDETRFEYRAALAHYRDALELDPEQAQARDNETRVEKIIVDLERFRDAEHRVSRDLVWVLLGLAALVTVGLGVRKRARG